jgi:hypothetical protein
MFELDAATGTVPLPMWAAGALLGVLVVACVAAFRRSGATASVAALVGVPALAIIAWSAWTLVGHSLAQERAAERRALELRALELTTRAITPGSALACLDAKAGEAVANGCEQAVFANPETVAAAVSYTGARLSLLAEALDYSRRSNGGYDATLADLRRGIEADRFGFVAQVLAERDGCTAEKCEALALLRNSGAVKANLAGAAYEKNVARYGASWGEKAEPVAAGLPASMSPAAPSVPSVVMGAKPIDFPSAASIPPVSIMNTEPAIGTAATAEASAPPRVSAPSAARRPAGGAATSTPPRPQ